METARTRERQDTFSLSICSDRATQATAQLGLVKFTRGHHEAETEDTKPGSGRPDPLSHGIGKDGEGGSRGQTQVGQQSPVSAHLRGFLRGTRQRLEVPLPMSKPWRR